MNYRLCFDIDGTLLSTQGAGGRSFRKAVFSLFKKDLDWSSISMAGCLDTGIFKEVLSALKMPYSDDLWQEFHSYYLKFLESEIKDTSAWVIFEGVLDLLERSISPKPLLITGNVKEGAFFKLKAASLDQYFDWDSSVFGDEGEHKRDELAEVYIKKNGADHIPVIIGDTPNDIRLAKLLNGVSVAVSTGIFKNDELSKYQADYLLDSLKDFPFSSFC